MVWIPFVKIATRSQSSTSPKISWDITRHKRRAKPIMLVGHICFIRILFENILRYYTNFMAQFMASWQWSFLQEHKHGKWSKRLQVQTSTTSTIGTELWARTQPCLVSKHHQWHSKFRDHYKLFSRQKWNKVNHIWNNRIKCIIFIEKQNFIGDIWNCSRSALFQLLISLTDSMVQFFVSSVSLADKWCLQLPYKFEVNLNLNINKWVLSPSRKQFLEKIMKKKTKKNSQKVGSAEAAF